jgi:hypothetical protein
MASWCIVDDNDFLYPVTCLREDSWDNVASLPFCFSSSQASARERPDVLAGPVKHRVVLRHP